MVPPASAFPVPPGRVEGWLPIAGLMNTKYFLLTGRVPQIHPAAMFLFVGFMLISLLMKKAFCSWLCPVGTFSEFLWRLGRRIFGRSLRLPRWFDISLRSLKYVLLGLFVAVIGVMSASALEDFMTTPYGLVADVKDAELLPRHRPHSRRCYRLMPRMLLSMLVQKSLVPAICLPLRRAHGTACLAAEPLW